MASTEKVVAGTAPGSGSPRNRRLGVLAIAFMVIAASAPLTVIAGGTTTAFSIAHNTGIPFGYIVLGVAFAIFSVGYVAMSRYINNAGAFYSYAAQGVGKPTGVGVSILALIAYNAMQIGIYGMLGFQVSSFIEQKTGWSSPWWMWVIICIVVVAILGMNRVDVSARVLGILVGFEFLVVIVFDVAGFAKPAEGFSAAPIGPHALLTTGVGAALVFGVAAFMGIEQGAIYSEEAKDPRHTVERATLLAVAVIGVFYAISSWALANVIGPDKILGIDGKSISGDEAGPPLYFNFVGAHLGNFWVDVMSILFITSLFASVQSFHNAVARYLFALGREGVLPSVLSRVGARSRSPWVGSIVQTVVALVTTVGFIIGGIGWDTAKKGPYPVVTLFTWLTNQGAFGLVLIMVVVSAAVVFYFRRDRRDVGTWTRLVAPIIAFVLMGIVWILILVNWNLLLGQTKSNVLTFLLPAILLVPSIAVGLWSITLKKSKPQVYAKIGRGSELEEFGSTARRE